MPRYARRKLNGEYYHIVVQGLKKEFIFNSKEDKQKYLEIIKNKLLKYKEKIRIIAYCIMGNHAHLLIRTSETQYMSDFMQRINTIYAKYYNSKNDRVGYVFKNRFYSEPIKNESHLKNCIVYIQKNPVKATMVANYKEYNYSSINEYLNERNIISEKELENIFGVSKGKAFKDIIGLLHDKYEEYEFLDVDKNENFKQFIELSKIIGRTNEQITIELSEKYKLSQRKIAELLNIKRNQVIKILK